MHYDFRRRNRLMRVQNQVQLAKVEERCAAIRAMNKDLEDTITRLKKELEQQTAAMAALEQAAREKSSGKHRAKGAVGDLQSLEHVAFCSTCAVRPRNTIITKCMHSMWLLTQPLQVDSIQQPSAENVSTFGCRHDSVNAHTVIFLSGRRTFIIYSSIDTPSLSFSLFALLPRLRLSTYTSLSAFSMSIILISHVQIRG